MSSCPTCNGNATKIAARSGPPIWRNDDAATIERLEGLLSEAVEVLDASEHHITLVKAIRKELAEGGE